jgi:hypothetical protein
MLDGIIGSSQDIAARLAERHRYPFEKRKDDLPQVTQYLKVKYGKTEPYRLLHALLKEDLRRRYFKELPKLENSESLDEMVELIGRLRQADDRREPHAMLARLPFPIFVTTNPDGLLGLTLRETQVKTSNNVKEVTKNPQIRTFRSSNPEEKIQKPVENSPLVYHLFGCRFDAWEHVLTQDDYLQYLEEAQAPVLTEDISNT